LDEDEGRIEFCLVVVVANAFQALRLVLCCLVKVGHCVLATLPLFQE